MKRSLLVLSSAVAVLVSTFVGPSTSHAQIIPPIIIPGPTTVSVNAFVSTKPVKIDVMSAAVPAAQALGSRPLFVATISAPAFGTATLGVDNTITYTPGENFPGSDTFTFTIFTETAGTVLGTVIVNRLPEPGKGNLAALLPGPFNIITFQQDPAFGMLQLSSLKTGSFSAKLQWKGAAYSFAGNFDKTGLFHKALKRKDLPGALNVRLAMTPSIVPIPLPGFTTQLVVTVLVADGTDVSTVQAAFCPYTAEAPTPDAGRHNMTFTGQPAFLSGSGWAQADVKPNGMVSLIGQLPDGSVVSGSSFLNNGAGSIAGSFPIYSGLYATKPRGSVSGVVFFGTSVAGTFNWSRAKEAKPLTLAEDIVKLPLTITGEKYTPPGGEPVPGGTEPNAVLRLQSGDPEMDFEVNVRVGAGKKAQIIGSNPRKVQLNVDAKKGTFSGTFVNASRQKKPFSGVILQSQMTGVGIFVGATNTQNVLLLPSVIP